MDDTLCQLSNELTKVRSERGIEFPHAIPEFWLDLPPITNAITSVNKLKADPDFDVYVLTAPSLRNPRSYMEKRLWIEKHFGYEFCEKLIICSNKGLLRGDYLIDDNIRYENFKKISFLKLFKKYLSKKFRNIIR